METQKKSSDKELKHLRFVRIAAIQTLVYVSNIYDYAKQNSGPLRSTVGTVENAVTTVVGPVYQKFKHLPDHLLVFIDNKVDDGAQKFDKHAPPVAKHVASQAQRLIHAASYKVQQLVNEARVGGPLAAVHFAAKESKDLAVTQSVKVWIKLNQLPAVHSVADIAVPTAAHWSDKYNHVVKDMTQKGYIAFGYLPLVPIDDITRAFKQGKAGEKEGPDAVAYKSDSS